MNLATARVAPEKAVFRPVLPLVHLPGMTEMHMATMTYREQLLHPNWQRKRLEIMQRDEFACKLCSDTETTLHVHHKQYAKGRMAWEYPADELVTLCAECHDTMHEQQGMLRDITAKLPVDGPGQVTSAAALLAGWANGSQGMDLSHAFGLSPTDFMAGEIAFLLEDGCVVHQLLALIEVLRSRDRYTVRAAIDSFIADLRTRANAVPSPLPQGCEEL
jgi:hypothetical protein